jgi:hypothetical protein
MKEGTVKNWFKDLLFQTHNLHRYVAVSPVHQAAHGLVDPVKGIALRFPRFLRLREDKTVEMATSVGLALFTTSFCSQNTFNYGQYVPCNQSDTLEWHFSRYFAVKAPTDDSQYGGPCNQSDTRE